MPIQPIQKKNVKRYIPFEDEVIVSLFPKYNDRTIGVVLRRTKVAITARRISLGVYKKTFPLSDEQVREVELLLLDDVPVISIQSKYNVSRDIIYSVRDRFFAKLSSEKPQYTLSAHKHCLGTPGRYWKYEEEILESLDPQYLAADLIDWEAEQITNRRIINGNYCVVIPSKMNNDEYRIKT